MSNKNNSQCDRGGSSTSKAKVKKQILEANKTTLKTYLRVILSANAVFVVINILTFNWTFNFYTLLTVGFATGVYFGSYWSMSVMAEPLFGEDGSLVDCGIDLNKKYGAGTPLKDVILLTAVIQVLSTISAYFWYLWLLVPVRVLFLYWMTSLTHWLAEDAPEHTWDEDEKKAT